MADIVECFFKNYNNYNNIINYYNNMPINDKNAVQSKIYVIKYFTSIHNNQNNLHPQWDNIVNNFINDAKQWIEDHLIQPAM